MEEKRIHTNGISSSSPMANAVTSSQDQPPADTSTEITYPEGGVGAWLVVLGASCGLTASLGIYNTSGVFEVVVSKVLLPEESASTVGWIFSIYAFVNWVCGVQVGPVFDAMGPHVLLFLGSVCTLVGMFSFSVCTGKIYTHLSLLCWYSASLANSDCRILSDHLVIFHLNWHRILPSDHTVNGLRRPLVHEASRACYWHSVHRRRIWWCSLPIDDSITPAQGWMGMVHPHSWICAACALRRLCFILSKTSSTTQRSTNWLERCIARSQNFHGWNRSYGTHNYRGPINRSGILHSYYLHTKLLYRSTALIS